uniref:Kinase n=1 Tax=Caenorhabditis tropicalis TaxID=1561998 RepID=A0A1I7TQ27_9PELO
MGQVTYDPLASAAKIEKESIKYPPQATMGMRILGYRIHRGNQNVEVRDKDWGKSFDETTVQNGLREFFSARDADLKQVLEEALDKLSIIKKYFESQKSFQFFASSLLFVYEADKTLPINLRIVMIDFSHAFTSNGKRDEGYLFGIQNLEIFLNSLLSEL